MTPEVAAGHVGRAGFLVTGPAVPLVGGHLNEVFRVPTSAGSVVLKHAPPYVAAAPEVPLDPDRLRHEALGLAMGGTLWRPGRVPRMVVYDPTHHVLCMEDLGDRPTLATWLAGASDAAAAALLTDLGRHLGQLHRAPADAWANPDVQATRHQLQYRQVPDFLAAHGYERGLGAQAVALGEALQRPGRGPIMGDLWLSSVLVDGHDWALIDWELSHLGAAAARRGAPAGPPVPGRPRAGRVAGCCLRGRLPGHGSLMGRCPARRRQGPRGQRVAGSHRGGLPHGGAR